MTWPDGAWAFAKWLTADVTRLAASVLMVAATLGYVAGGVGVLVRGAWGPSLTGWAAVFSTILFIMFWDGKAQKLSDQGGYGILINLGILVWVLLG